MLSLGTRLALVPLVYVAVNVGSPILVIGLLGFLVTFAYAKSKFNWTHEIVLGAAAGPLAVLAGMFATTSSPPWARRPDRQRTVRDTHIFRRPYH